MHHSFQDCRLKIIVFTGTTSSGGSFLFSITVLWNSSLYFLEVFGLAILFLSSKVFELFHMSLEEIGYIFEATQLYNRVFPELYNYWTLHWFRSPHGGSLTTLARFFPFLVPPKRMVANHKLTSPISNFLVASCFFLMIF